MRVMRGWKGEGCLVVWVRGITRDEGLEGEGGGGLSGHMGQRGLHEMRGLEGVGGGGVVWLHGSKGLHERGRVIHSIRGCWVKN